jgi:hypothetical protein
MVAVALLLTAADSACETSDVVWSGDRIDGGRENRSRLGDLAGGQGQQRRQKGDLPLYDGGRIARSGGP